MTSKFLKTTTRFFWTWIFCLRPVFQLNRIHRIHLLKNGWFTHSECSEFYSNGHPGNFQKILWTVPLWESNLLVDPSIQGTEFDGFLVNPWASHKIWWSPSYSIFYGKSSVLFWIFLVCIPLLAPPVPFFSHQTCVFALKQHADIPAKTLLRSMFLHEELWFSIRVCLKIGQPWIY